MPSSMPSDPALPWPSRPPAPAARARRTRALALVVAVVIVGACSGGDGDRVEARNTGKRATTTTSTQDPTTTETAAPETSVAESPTPTEGAPEEVAAEAVAGGDDPVPQSAVRPRAASTGAAPSGRKAAGRVQPTGHIDIPAIGLSHPTYEGIDLATINHGPSHWPDTAFPGEIGNTVFPGHRTTYSRPFWDIDKLVPGNEVIFTTPAGRFTYHVTETFVVNASATWIVNPTEDATFTIFACHPKGSARQRYVAKGKLVSAPAPARQQEGAARQPQQTTSTTARRSPTTTTTAPPQEPGLLPPLSG